MAARVLLLDNKDSFVWNLAQAFGVLGATVDVVRSDTVDAAAVGTRAPDLIVLSPGPGRPEQAGCCVEVVRAHAARLPILGICLGHQAIGAAFGARIDRAPPCHGKAWTIEHDGDGTFAGLPNPFVAGRYHSLVVNRSSLPDDLVVDAWTPEGELMAMHHRDHPHVIGWQFHPESFRTPVGLELLGRVLHGDRRPDSLTLDDRSAANR